MLECVYKIPKRYKKRSLPKWRIFLATLNNEKLFKQLKIVEKEMDQRTPYNRIQYDCNKLERNGWFVKHIKWNYQLNLLMVLIATVGLKRASISAPDSIVFFVRSLLVVLVEDWRLGWYFSAAATGVLVFLFHLK